ncbi:hypothetical protein GY45DRAFT_1349836 [Cubamyces sp. BRFM 1775]|nr:hypothetical protein GY45DRAFT_1349836 [Cubamyces sp. BRFM 1775]
MDLGTGRIVALLAGRPNGEDWDSVAAEADEAMGKAAGECRFKSEDCDHRRGRFAALARGISFGGGRAIPGTISNSRRNERALRALCQHRAMLRIAGFGSCMLATYAPRVYANMRQNIDDLLKHHPNLRLNFPNSAYPAASFNFGPATECYPHLDAANEACNWCHITALGSFNAKTGGHAVLHDLKLVIEFPSGSSILIPSALFKHGNTPIQPGEHRRSFTQYCAGGLLRWVRCGFRTVREYAKVDAEGKAAYEAEMNVRVEECVARWTTLEELHLEDTAGLDEVVGSEDATAAGAPAKSTKSARKKTPKRKRTKLEVEEAV